MESPNPKGLFDGLTIFQIWLIAITGMWGGLVGYLKRLQAGQKFRVWHLVMHIVTSGFAGLICWLICTETGVSPGTTAICAGMSGYMGAEFLQLVEAQFKTKVLRMAPGRRAED